MLRWKHNIVQSVRFPYSSLFKGSERSALSINWDIKIYIGQHLLLLHLNEPSVLLKHTLNSCKIATDFPGTLEWNHGSWTKHFVNFFTHVKAFKIFTQNCSKWTKQRMVCNNYTDPFQCSILRFVVWYLWKLEVFWFLI